MGAIMLVKGSEVARTEVKEAVSKFLKIFSEEITFDDASSVSQSLGLMEMRTHSVVFIDEDLSKEDLNLLSEPFNALKKRPMIVTTPQNVELLKGFVEPKNLKSAPYGLSKGFVFDYLRSVIVNKDRKIDPRVLGSILRGIMNVVNISSGMTLTPQPVKTARSQVEVNDVTAICSFYGDGLQGALIATTSDAFVNMMASAVFALPPEEITSDIKNDLLLEVLNQLTGALRQELGEFGYELSPTVFFVASGEKHSYLSRSNGKYFDMPFICQDQPFNVTFCYDIYSDFLRYAELSRGNAKDKKYLDVRLVNGTITSVKDTISANLGLECRHAGDKIYTLDNYKSELVSVAHGVGPGANYTFLMSLKQEHARVMASKLLYMPPEEISVDMVVDSCGELLNQMIAQFRGRAEGQNYPFRPVFHADFSRTGPVDFMLKGQGRFLTLAFETTEFPFVISFGIESIRTPALFDIHEWLRRQAVA
jgi:CheY-specific phosphatase CheX